MSKGALHAAAEGKYADDGSGGGNGLSYGLLAAISLGTAGILAIAPHTVSYACTRDQFHSTFEHIANWPRAHV